MTQPSSYEENQAVGHRNINRAKDAMQQANLELAAALRSVSTYGWTVGEFLSIRSTVRNIDNTLEWMEEQMGVQHGK